MTERSSWDECVTRSNYHFNPQRKDVLEDMIKLHGSIYPTWTNLMTQIIHNARPATWETRGYKGDGNPIPSDDLAAEEYDIARVGGDPKAVISHLNWEIPPLLQGISDMFGLDDMMTRIHVQLPGEVWHRHIDKLHKWCPREPWRVKRIFIHLTDWQPGQFWEMGNHHYQHWSAGDVFSFDWGDIPHCTANAGHHPRVTLQLTGISTRRTDTFLRGLRQHMVVHNV